MARRFFRVGVAFACEFCNLRPRSLVDAAHIMLRCGGGTQVRGFTFGASMALRVQWYRDNANERARRAEQSRDPLGRAAYREMVRAWIMLAEGAEQLASAKSIRPELGQADRVRRLESDLDLTALFGSEGCRARSPSVHCAST
jgi:hypothetical protein